MAVDSLTGAAFPQGLSLHCKFFVSRIICIYVVILLVILCDDKLYLFIAVNWVFMSTSKRPPMSQGAVQQISAAAKRSSGLSLRDLRGIAAPVSARTLALSLRVSGAWLELLEFVRSECPGVSDAELFRQGLALRAALLASDDNGKKPRATITYMLDGKEVTVDLEEHVGLKR